MLSEIFIASFHVCHLALQRFIKFDSPLNLADYIRLIRLLTIQRLLQSLDLLALLLQFPTHLVYQPLKPVDLSPLLLHLFVERNALLLELTLDVPDLRLVVLCTLVELVDLGVALDHIPLEGEEPVFIGFTHFAQFLKVVFLKFFNLYSLKGKVV